MAETTKEKRPPGIRLLRLIGKMFLILMGLLILLILLIRTPYVQDIIVGKVEGFLREKTDAEITIGRAYLDFSGNILVEDVLIPDTNGDTILQFRELAVGISLAGLLNSTIKVGFFRLRDLSLNAHPTADSVMNYQYLIDAFSVDTVDTKAKVTDEETQSAWNFAMPDAQVILENLHLRYRDVGGSISTDSKIGLLHLHTSTANPLEGEAELKKLIFEDSDIRLTLNPEPSTSGPDTVILAYMAGIRTTRITNVHVDLVMPDMSLATGIHVLEADRLKFEIDGDTILLEAEDFIIENSTYRMDMAGAPYAKGFDYNHMNLDSINLSARQISYKNLDIRARVDHASVRDTSGFALTALQGKVHYTPDSITIVDLVARTPYSQIDIPVGKVQFPGEADASMAEKLQTAIEIRNTQILLEDMGYFVPSLYTMEAWPTLKSQKWKLDGEINGTLANLHLEGFEAGNGSSHLLVTGDLQNVTSIEDMTADLQIRDLSTRGKEIAPWLPPGASETGQKLPDYMNAQGTLSGSLSTLRFNLEGALGRIHNPVSAAFQIQGIAKSLLDKDKFYLDIDIDTLWASDTEIATWMPDSLKQQFSIPNQVGMSGKVTGNLDTLRTAIQVSTRRGSGQTAALIVNGGISDYTIPSNMRFNFDLPEIEISTDEILRYLPDSILPGYIAVPAIKAGSGKISGSLDSLSGGIALSTTAGSINADMTLVDSSYQLKLDLEKVVLQEIIPDSTAYDTIVGWDAPPISLTLDVNGSGFDLDSNLLADFRATLLLSGDSLHWDNGLVIEGTLDRRSFVGNVSIDEPSAIFDLAMIVNFNPGEESASITGSVEGIDFYSLGFAEKPLNFSANLQASADGFSLHDMDVNFEVNDLYVRIDSIYEYTEHVTASIRRDTAEQLLNVQVSSDFLTMTLFDRAHHKSEFDAEIGRLTERMERRMQNMAEIEDSSGLLFLNLKVTRPEFFTSGIIPGLKELEPVEILGAYNRLDTSVVLYADIPHAQYYSHTIDSVSIRASNWRDAFLIALNIRQAVLFNNTTVRDLRIYTVENRSDTTRIFLIQRDSLLAPDKEQTRRFRIGANVVSDSGRYVVSFRENPILNFDTLWQINPENKISFSNQKLRIENFELKKGEQSIAIEEEKGVIQANFHQFDLALLANAYKWNSDLILGILDGSVEIEKLFSTPAITSEVTISDFGVNGSVVGNIDLEAAMDTVGNWQGGLDLDGKHSSASATAEYEGVSGKINAELNGTFDNISDLVPLVSSYIDSANGAMTTDLTLSGTFEKPVLVGSIGFRSIYLKPALTKSPLYIDNANFNFSETRIGSSENIIIRDSHYGL